MAQETESKFYVVNSSELEQRVQALGAERSEPRVLEVNLRFDTAAGDLRKAGRVLRLRLDRAARLTYKEGGQFEGGAMSRREVEFAVSDFRSAQEFIEALGYEVAFIYEKRRTTYKWNEVEIMLDEMPYGHFVEIEGERAAVQSAAQRLGLDAGTAIADSYSALFERLKGRLGLDFRDLTFDNFKGRQIRASDLGVRVGDGN